MHKKFLISIFLSAIFLLNTASADDMKQAQFTIIEQIKSGQIQSASENVNKFLADYRQDANLPIALFEIAQNYGWAEKHEDEKNIYQKIMQNYPDCSISAKVKLSYSKANVQSLIISKKFDDAKAALDKMTSEFSQNPDLPEMLYWIGERYGFVDRLEEEKNVYQMILQNYPNSAFASKAAMGYLRSRTRSFIYSRNYDKAKLTTAKLITDFKGEPGLPDAIYIIARNFGWAHRYEEEKWLYKFIMQNYPDNSNTNSAKLGYVRAQINSLILSGKSDEAKAAFADFVQNFSNYSNFESALKSIANRWIWAGNYQEAKNTYQKIIEKNPGSDYAAKAQANISVINRGVELFSLIDANKTDQVPAKIEQLVSDFNGNELLAQTLQLCGERYSKRGFQQGSMADSGRTENFVMAIVIWHKIIDMPESTTTPYTYYYSANCYDALGEYEKSIEYFQKIADAWPNFEYAWDVQFKIGYTYNKMLAAGRIGQSEAKQLIASAYKKVLEKYPDCKVADLAKSWLENN